MNLESNVARLIDEMILGINCFILQSNTRTEYGWISMWDKWDNQECWWRWYKRSWRRNL